MSTKQFPNGWINSANGLYLYQSHPYGVSARAQVWRVKPHLLRAMDAVPLGDIPLVIASGPCFAVDGLLYISGWAKFRDVLVPYLSMRMELGV